MTEQGSKLVATSQVWNCSGLAAICPQHQSAAWETVVITRWQLFSEQPCQHSTEQHPLPNSHGNLLRNSHGQSLFESSLQPEIGQNWQNNIRCLAASTLVGVAILWTHNKMPAYKFSIYMTVQRLE